MLLTLKVKNCRGIPLSEPTSICFDKKGGTIGRAADNDLVLPDTENFISRRHAEIRYEGGRYILADISLSGTLIDDGQPLKKRSAELRNGMRIQIGDYELGVSIEETSDEGTYPGELYESDRDSTDIVASTGKSSFDRVRAGESLPDFNEEPSFDFSEDSADPFNVFADEQAAPPDPLSSLESKSRVLDSFNPPNARFEPEAVDFPEDFDFEELLGIPPQRPSEPLVKLDAIPQQSTDDDFPLDDRLDFDLPREPGGESPVDRPIPAKPVAQVQPQKPVAEPKAPPVETKLPENSIARAGQTSASAEGGRPGDSVLNVLFDAMGLDQPDFPRRVSEEELLRLIGEMLHELIEGIMILLRSRAELKNQFRISVTTIRPVENNPLKFSVRVPDALNALLKPGQKGYLKPLEAIRNGFEDVSNHQLAMSAGIQGSLTHLLKQFDPERFKKQIERGLFSNKDAKCWEAYSEAYEQLVSEAIEDFFGNAFIKAYEKQVQALELGKGKK